MTSHSNIALASMKGVIDGTFFTYRLMQQLGPVWAFSGIGYVLVAVC